MNKIIYLDNAATTPVSADVLAAMQPYFQDIYGNPSSVHQLGRKSKAAIDHAREQVAKAIHATPSEIVFTSGGTEADNAAVLGAALARQAQGRHVVTTAIEHHAVLHTCQFLQQIGFDVTYVKPNSNGVVSVQAIEQALRPDTVLLSVMTVNNETGAIQPIEQIGALAQARGIAFHTDAVQAAGLLPLDVQQMHVDLLSISGHKLHGPKGTGALYINRNLKWTPYMHGGSQELKRRGGTENLAGIVGLGLAIQQATEQRADKYKHIRALRDAMLHIFQKQLDRITVNSPAEALPSILNVTFHDVLAERLLMNLDMQGIIAAAGSACTSGSLQPSHVLTAMDVTEDCVRSAIRFSFSGQNTLEEVTEATNKVCQFVERLRNR